MSVSLDIMVSLGVYPALPSVSHSGTITKRLNSLFRPAAGEWECMLITVPELCPSTASLTQ